MARTGRRPGGTDTRAAILASATESFAERGYAGVTIRQVAAAAAVDPALVHHYFHTKEQLFLAALREVVEPRRVLAELLCGATETLGERIVVRFLQLWEGGAGATASALLRTAVTSDRVERLVREVVFPAVATELTGRAAGGPVPPRVRAALIASQLSGLVTTRYVLRLPPMADASIAWLGETIGPTIQRYLTGELPAPGPAA